MLQRPLITLLAAASLGWTAAGETCDPVLAPRDLPPDLGACAQAACVEGPSYLTRWIGRARAADLFIVVRDSCTSAGCGAWLVARHDRTTTTLLALSGQFRLEPAGGRYPAVQARTELGTSYTSYHRYEWDGARYVRTQTRLVHRVDGIECGSESECDTAARDAMAQGHADRAVRIWEQVHGVAWI